ncbi:hypothetical protein DL546_009639 [Coniochaeta pulveracea]|uniref:NADH dehydrogenase [ubiquinone] 1 alpha subcomplex subunit 1 n=1 Tax=Coniochaeta pulveracea TaxID=177199 RepID=A0A420YN36_9PEZI|nr:hypothetical protein DL546_009639 [Coniochaeta pulveracea]
MSIVTDHTPNVDDICPASRHDIFRVYPSSSTTVAMPVPFETLIPYGIILAMFGVTGAGLSKIRHMQNGGKRARRSLDQWDRQMMERDRRLTGMLRGQTDNPSAPPGFELNNPWKTETRMS